MSDASNQEQKSPIFSIVGAICAGFALFSPLILVTLPLMVAAVCSVIGLVRKEKPRWLAPVALALSLVLLVASANQMAGLRKGLTASASTDDLASAEIVDWSWEADSDFGTDGTVKWRVSVKNKTDKPIESVELQFTTYDADNKMIATDRSWVRALPPGGVRNEESFADYYGTEKTANVEVVGLRYAR